MDFAVDRCVKVRGGLDRFNHAKFIAFGQCGADLGQFDKYHVAKRRLGVVGNADSDRAVLMIKHPLVALSVTKIGRKVAHDESLYETDVELPC